MSDPYRIEGPALLSISGGRTSGFMLRKILDAHDGKLPADVIPVFCNTGKEHEATLVFLREIEDRWGCEIVWLEYTRRDRVSIFRVVDFCKAARNGEPFASMIEARRFLPNTKMRFCTTELKTLTAKRYAESLGWDDWTVAIGLRADEPWRVAKSKENGDGEPYTPRWPMHAAGHVVADVLGFWEEQPFDLLLPGGDNTFGNCDLCFMKRKSQIAKIMRTTPRRSDWWIEQEERTTARFRKDWPTYRSMLTQVTIQGQMFDDAVEDDTLPCNCTD